MLPIIFTVLIFGAISTLLFWVPSHYAVVDNSKYTSYIKYVTDSANGGKFQSDTPNAVRFGTYMGKELTLANFIYTFFTYWFLDLSSTSGGGLGLALLYVLFVSIFWFFGLHGSNIMNGIFGPIWLSAIVANTNAYSAGKPLEYVVTQPFFDGFIFMGGWGAGLSLLACTLLLGRDKQAREVSKLTIAPGLFNINEPITFAYPLMLNFILITPAVIAPLLFTVITFLAINGGLVPKTVLYIPWIAPIGIGGLLATLSGWGFLLAVINFLIGILIYWPFILISNAQAKKRGTLVPGNFITWTNEAFKKARLKKTNQPMITKTQTAKGSAPVAAKVNQIKEAKSKPEQEL